MSTNSIKAILEFYNSIGARIEKLDFSEMELSSEKLKAIISVFESNDLKMK